MRMDNLSNKTWKFAVKIVMLYKALPKSTEAQILGQQLLRCGTAIGAHYHEAKQARSSGEFVSKIDLSLQELEETDYWINVILDCQIAKQEICKNCKLISAS